MEVRLNALRTAQTSLKEIQTTVNSIVENLDEVEMRLNSCTMPQSVKSGFCDAQADLREISAGLFRMADAVLEAAFRYQETETQVLYDDNSLYSNRGIMIDSIQGFINLDPFVYHPTTNWQHTFFDFSG